MSSQSAALLCYFWYDCLATTILPLYCKIWREKRRVNQLELLNKILSVFTVFLFTFAMLPDSWAVFFLSEMSQLLSVMTYVFDYDKS